MQQWSTYDAADRVLILRGQLSEGQVQLSAEGLQYEYSAGRRSREYYLGADGQRHVRDIAYWSNNTLKSVVDSSGDTKTYTYDATGNVTMATSSSPYEKTSYTYYPDGQVSAVTCYRDAVNADNYTKTEFNLTGAGQTAKQITMDTTQRDNGLLIYYEMSYYYLGLEEPTLDSIRGFTYYFKDGNRKPNKDFPPITNSYDDNGALSLVINISNQSNSGTQEVSYQNTSDGLVLSKTIYSQSEGGFWGRSQVSLLSSYYFYNVNNQYEFCNYLGHRPE